METIIIEGFPRSGTTFLYELVYNGFLNNQVYYSEHTASKLKLDNVIATVRNPYSCIFSWKSNFAKNDNISDIAKWYIRYHEEMLNNISSILVVDFNELITDTNRIVEKISNNFNILYTPVDFSKLNKDESQEKYDYFITKETKEAYQLYKEVLRYS